MMLPAEVSRTGVKNSYWTFALLAAIVLASMRNNTGLGVVYATELIAQS